MPSIQEKYSSFISTKCPLAIKWALSLKSIEQKHFAGNDKRKISK